MATIKPLANNINTAVTHIIEKAGDAGKFYRADIHRSVVTRVVIDALVSDGHLKEDERQDASMLVYGAMAQESTLLEHSNFKQSRLMANGVIPKAEDKPKGMGLVM